MHNPKSVTADFNKDAHKALKIAIETFKLMGNLIKIMGDPGKDDAKHLRIMHNPINSLHDFDEINAKHENISHHLKIRFRRRD